jgi:putative ABC transport system ATP-binding protein
VSVLELRSVSRCYGQGAAEVVALSEVSVVVEAGELVAVMGPSGSGKSTLLTIAGTLEEASSGEVLIDGVAVSTLSLDERAALRRHRIGYVFQDFNLLSGLTAVENVAMPLELDGQARTTARKAAMTVLDRLGLTGLAERFPDELSGGERQRTAIARAVVGQRRLLLADEPTGALDSLNGESVLRLLRQACRDGVAGVIVTHDAQLASRADRIIYLRDGGIVDESPAMAGPESLLVNRPRP